MPPLGLSSRRREGPPFQEELLQEVLGAPAVSLTKVPRRENWGAGHLARFMQASLWHGDCSPKNGVPRWHSRCRKNSGSPAVRELQAQQVRHAKCKCRVAQRVWHDMCRARVGAIMALRWAVNV